MSIFDQPFDRSRDAAVVTGAGNGIGRAIALALVAEGVRTLFADNNADAVGAAVKSAANPALALSWVGDLAARAECDRLLADARKQLGLVTLFVHSASPPRREEDHVLAVGDETWERMRAVNLDAGFHLGREIARSLIAAKSRGSMLYLTSLHAHTPRNLPHYSTTKAAMSILVKELARTLGRFGIRVNVVEPGWIDSPMTAALSPDLRNRAVGETLLGRIGRPEDVAGAVLFLCSDLSQHITGQVLRVDGGQLVV